MPTVKEVFFDDAVELTSPQALDPSDASHQVLLQVACDTAWLLDHHNLAPVAEGFQKRYRSLLFEQGLASYAGSINYSKFMGQIQSCYSSELLSLLFTQLDASRPFKWLPSLLHASHHGHPPIHHLLLMQFLGYTAEQFINLSPERRLFGEGPWPCLNPICEQYEQPTIQECQILHDPFLCNGRPRGLFACRCGFTYLRVGPDQSPEDRFRIGAHKAYGPKWEAWLQEGWLDASVTLTQLSNQLGVGRDTLMRQAARLGLPIPRPGKRKKRRAANPAQPRKRVEEKFETKRAACRSAWLSALETHLPHVYLLNS